MKILAKWFGVVATAVLMVGSVAATDVLTAGTVKSIDADAKEFVLTDGSEKDWTLKFADDVVINRGGRESNTDLKVGDPISVAYQKGIRTWTAHYILVKIGQTKDCQLAMGTFKGYDATKKSVTSTDVDGKDWTYITTDAKVRLNMQPSNIEEMKVGDTVLMIVHQDGTKTTLTHLMAGRTK